jgi:hypothetical protein
VQLCFNLKEEIMSESSIDQAKHGAGGTSRADSCEKRIDSNLQSRIDDLRCLSTAYREGNGKHDERGTLAEYGLCFDYVSPSTYDDQKEAFFRYQLSWGGPSDEFRFFVNPDFSCHRIEYWFLDWFDGAHRVLSGDAEALLADLWEWFRDAGAAVIASARDEDEAP